MKQRNVHQTQLCLVAALFGVTALAFTPTAFIPSRSAVSGSVVDGIAKSQSPAKSSINKILRLYGSVEQEADPVLSSEQATNNDVTALAAQEAYPNAEILTMTLKKHRPLGCTVEESMDTLNDPTVVFVSKVVADGNAETAGIQVGDVLIGVTGLFGGSMTPVWQSGVEKIKGLVGGVADDEPLMLQLARGTGVLDRHEASIVDMCQTPGASDKEVEDCVVDFLAAGYDTSVVVQDKSVKGTDGSGDEECDPGDDEADCMIDNMINMWADDLPLPPTTSGIMDVNGNDSASKPKPWSSRSSPSGTFVRDPVTGEMRNIDA